MARSAFVISELWQGCHSVRQLIWKVSSVSSDPAGIIGAVYQNWAVKLLFRCHYLRHMQPVLWGGVLERLRCVESVLDTVHIRANVCLNLGSTLLTGTGRSTQEIKVYYFMFISFQSKLIYTMQAVAGASFVYLDLIPLQKVAGRAPTQVCYFLWLGASCFLLRRSPFLTVLGLPEYLQGQRVSTSAFNAQRGPTRAPLVCS